MILGLFRRAANETIIDRLYAALVAASRQSALYRDMAVPDTFEGRFESLTVHAALVLRRLKGSEAPGPDMAQHLVDTVFRHFDRTLREMGVGDTTVPKRMKTLAEAFLGRSIAYDEALRSAGLDELRAALRRNISPSERDMDVSASVDALAKYVAAAAAGFAATPLAAFIDGTIAFPDAAAFAGEVPA